MTIERLRGVPVRLSTLAALALLAVGTAWGGGSAAAQGTCNPSCAPGQSCVQGICMIPAPPAGGDPSSAGTAPPTNYAPPPSANQQPGYYPPPPQNYPPAASAPPAYYAPPANNPPPPPPGYTAPGGYSQPGAYPPPAGYGPPPDERPIRRRGFLALPYLGLNSYQGVNAENFGPGFRLGALLGGRLNEKFSINGEITVDVVNVNNPPVDTDVSAVDAVLALSPLWHFADGNAEFVVGPKLGLRRYVENDDVSTGDTTTYTLTGYVVGVNVGWFGAISDSMSIGGLLNFDFRTLHESCQKSPGFADNCSTSGNGPSDKVLGITGALLF